jgi:hypothetical protein
MVDTNGVLIWPTNLFGANSNLFMEYFPSTSAYSRQLLTNSTAQAWRSLLDVPWTNYVWSLENLDAEVQGMLTNKVGIDDVDSTLWTIITNNSGGTGTGDVTYTFNYGVTNNSVSSASIIDGSVRSNDVDTATWFMATNQTLPALSGVTLAGSPNSFVLTNSDGATLQIRANNSSPTMSFDSTGRPSFSGIVDATSFTWPMASSGGTMDMTKTFQYHSTDTGIEINSLVGVNPSKVTQAAMILKYNKAEAGIALRVPEMWRMANGQHTFYATNGQILVLSVQCYGDALTNGACALFY